MRNRSLLALSQIRKGESLTYASKEQGITTKEIQQQLGKYLYKKKGRWTAKPIDRIERARWLFSNGERKTIIINNSKDASLISSYLNFVKKAIIAGDDVHLEPFKGKTVVDISGKKHTFETDLNILYLLDEMIESDHPLQIYDDNFQT